MLETMNWSLIKFKKSKQKSCPNYLIIFSLNLEFKINLKMAHLPSLCVSMINDSLEKFPHSRCAKKNATNLMRQTVIKKSCVSNFTERYEKTLIFT